MVAIWRRPKITMLKTIGHFRPNLSPARPKPAAPTERSKRVNVIAVEMLVLSVL